MTTLEQINKWLKQVEDLNLEFKAAKNQFDEKKALPDYCAALANEGGGKLILGVDDKGTVVGTKAFVGTYNTLSHKLLRKILLRVDVEEFHHPGGRLLIFHIPSRPVGQRIQSTGNYYYPMRVGESLVEMDELKTKKILNETQLDFSAMVVPKFNINDLDDVAIQRLREMCFKKSNNKNYLVCSLKQFLRDLGLSEERGLNYACLILLGNKEVLNEKLPVSEIIFEWRQIAQKIPYDFRRSWREPFLKIFDDIWDEINKRNLRTPYKEGFLQREVFAFDKDSTREAILNAVVHRDYTIKGQVIFINASVDNFSIESPGGFLPGITPENAIHSRAWRNQRLAEIFEKAGLIERSGQGLNIIYEKAIRDGKGVPDLSKSDNYDVRLDIPAKVKDVNFILFLTKVAEDKQISFTFDEILELEKIRKKQVITNPEYRKSFIDIGIIEKIGTGRGTRYILSHNYYVSTGKAGVHTRLKGTSREQKKQLILNHLKKNKKGRANQFQDIFPELKLMDISNLLRELKSEGRISYFGHSRSGYWKLS